MKLLGAFVVLTCLVVVTRTELASFSLPSPWSYECDDSNSSIGGHIIGPRCVKVSSALASVVQGLAACKMTCGEHGQLWPQPTGQTKLSKKLVHFLPKDIQLVSVASSSETVSNMVNQFFDVFREYLYYMQPDYEGGYKNPFVDKPYITSTKIQVSVSVEQESVKLTTETDESYNVVVEDMVTNTGEKIVAVKVTARTYFGARHGLETLSQLISYDDFTDSLQIYQDAVVIDKPAFPHRGLLIDTARNFVSVSVIKSIISAMSYNKLNVFHWHITDTHSFPMQSRRVPQLTLHGAYSPRKVYTVEQIKAIVEYGRLRGVHVLPEFDAPAHVGNGWQFGEKEGKGRLAVCVNEEPWQDFCVEPPCGQLNPVNPHVYTTLEKLYQDFFEVFEIDMFHMGGDEVNLNCWNSTREVKEAMAAQGKSGTEEDLLELWNQFQKQALAKVYKAAGRKVPVILWTNHLTEKGRVERFLSKDDYIIQIWTTGEDSVISELINKGYKVIFSNYDAWYLDCGYSSWVGEGNNWCSPYKGWQKVYDNSPKKMYRDQGGDSENEHLILGGEAAMWAEQVDGAAIQGKLWPRGSALAERLWSDPEEGWKAAEIRMINQRQRLVERGISADALQPEWCHQNEGMCYVKK